MTNTFRKYVHAVVGRFGLANMLMVWARAEIFRHEHGLPMLRPQWFNPLRLGPWLRREKDKRLYLNQFGNLEYITGLKRFLLLAMARRVEETERPVNDTKGPTLILIRFTLGGFHPIVKHRDFLRRQLMKMVQPAIHKRFTLEKVPYIGIHVRRGDMVSAGLSVGLDWYATCLKVIRETIGDNYPARIFSDGTSDELQVLLKLPNVCMHPTGPSVQDLLLLSKSRVLIATNNSTFSKWAAMLGSMPVFYTECKDDEWDAMPDHSRVVPVPAYGHIYLHSSTRNILLEAIQGDQLVKEGCEEDLHA
jgi:hypothetical protein